MPEPAFVSIRLDGTELRVTAGSSVAAALANRDWTATRIAVSGEPRAALCGMGICFECRITIDGVALRRGCLEIVREGMVVTTSHA